MICEILWSLLHAKVTRAKIIRYCGISNSTLSKCLSGQQRSINFETGVKVCELYRAEGVIKIQPGGNTMSARAFEFRHTRLLDAVRQLNAIGRLHTRQYLADLREELLSFRYEAVARDIEANELDRTGRKVFSVDITFSGKRWTDDADRLLELYYARIAKATIVEELIH